MDIEKLAKQIQRNIRENEGATMPIANIVRWLEAQDEDELVANSIDALAEMFLYH